MYERVKKRADLVKNRIPSWFSWFHGFVPNIGSRSVLFCEFLLRSLDGETLQGDEDTVWKLLNAASDASADLAPMIDKIRTDDVVVDSSKTMSGDGTWVGKTENEVGTLESQCHKPSHKPTLPLRII